MKALLLTSAVILAGCQGEELYSGLSQEEANDIIEVLRTHNIDAKKKDQDKAGKAILVSKSQLTDAIKLLKKHGLPKQKYDSVIDVFKGDGIIASPLEEKARYIYAVSQELGQTLSQVDGVLNARVHVVLPETDELGRETSPSSVAVFIKHKAGMQITSLIPNIKLLVFNSIQGLDYSKISVALFPSDI